jgi:hypothetical protein
MFFVSTIRTGLEAQSRFLRGISAERLDEKLNFGRFLAGIFTV